MLSLLVHVLIFALYLADFQPPLVRLNAAQAAEPVKPQTVQIRITAQTPVVTRQPEPVIKPKPEMQPKPAKKPERLKKPEPSKKPKPKPVPVPIRKPVKPTQPQIEEHKPTPDVKPLTESASEPAPAVTNINASASAPLHAQPADTTITAQTKKQQLRQNQKQQYLAYLGRVIAKQQRYPKQSRRRHEEGVVSVRVTINDRGQLLSVHMIENSRYNRLNRESLAMVRRAAPFQPLPPTLAGKPLTVVLPIKFDLKG